MEKEFKIERQDKDGGKRGVKLERDSFYLSLGTCRNGWQWTYMPVDDELLHMIRDAINQYFLEKDWDGGA